MQIYKGFRVEMGESYIVRSRYCESRRFNGNQRPIFILQHLVDKTNFAVRKRLHLLIYN